MSDSPVLVAGSDRARVFVAVSSDGAPMLFVRLRGWDAAKSEPVWWTAFSAIARCDRARDAMLAAVRVLIPAGRYDLTAGGTTTKSGVLVALGDLLRGAA